MVENGQRPVKRRRWLRWLLIVSLGLNLLVAGAAVGLLIKWPSGHYPHGGSFLGVAGLGVISGALTDADRHDIGDELRSRGKSFKRDRDQANQNARRLVSILRADPFKPEQLEEFFEDQRNQVAAMLSEGHSLIAPRILAMSTEQRHEYADRIERRLGRRK